MVALEAADLPAVVVGDDLGDDIDLGHDAGQRGAILHEAVRATDNCTAQHMP